MNDLLNDLRRLIRRERGQTLFEYAMIMALVVILCVAALGALQLGVSSMISAVGAAF